MELHNSEMRISLIIALFLIPKVGKSQMALPTFQGAQMPHTTIFENLQTLAVSLDALTSITKSNFGSVQSTIEGADGSFHVFAVVGYGNMAENLQGTGASGGTTSFSSLRFVYNSSASNILSTGNTIAAMTGSDTVGGEVTDPAAALASYMEIYATAGWYSIGAGVLAVFLVPLLRHFMHGIK